MENFTPIASTIGGLLIGLSSALILIFNGRIAGISGIAGGAMSAKKEDLPWRFAFLIGMIGSGAVMAMVSPSVFAGTVSRSTLAWIAGGLLVGFGTRFGNGCTSGHGICGLSRLSIRSLISVLTFMFVAGVVTYLVNHVFGGTV